MRLINVFMLCNLFTDSFKFNCCSYHVKILYIKELSSYLACFPILKTVGKSKLLKTKFTLNSFPTSKKANVYIGQFDVVAISIYLCG